jgi:hypothetical protein
MKVYFHASVGQRNTYGECYRRIVEYLEKSGHEVDAIHALSHKLDELKKARCGPATCI